MKYRDKITGHIYQSMFEIQLAYSHVSFPLVWTQDTFDFVNVEPVTEVGMPTPHPYNRMNYSVQQINGMWTEVWTEVPKYDDVTQQAAWVAEYDEMHKQSVLEKYDIYVAAAKAERNKKLQDTDYTQLPDTPITVECRDAFKVYRQTLRDMDFQNPFDIIWPEIPQYVKQ